MRTELSWETVLLSSPYFGAIEDGIVILKERGMKKPLVAFSTDCSPSDFYIEFQYTLQIREEHVAQSSIPIYIDPKNQNTALLLINALMIHLMRF